VVHVCSRTIADAVSAFIKEKESNWGLFQIITGEIIVLVDFCAVRRSLPVQSVHCGRDLRLSTKAFSKLLPFAYY
jgi:hypothetical protein